MQSHHHDMPININTQFHLLDDVHCIAIKGDTSDLGGGSSLYLVSKGDADTIDPAVDFFDDKSILLDAYHKVRRLHAQACAPPGSSRCKL